MKIVAIDKQGKEGGVHKEITDKKWALMQHQFGKNLRWRKVKETVVKTVVKEEVIIKEIKKDTDERKKRKGTSDLVEKD